MVPGDTASRIEVRRTVRRAIRCASCSSEMLPVDDMTRPCTCYECRPLDAMLRLCRLGGDRIPTGPHQRKNAVRRQESTHALSQAQGDTTKLCLRQFYRAEATLCSLAQYGRA